MIFSQVSKLTVLGLLLGGFGIFGTLDYAVPLAAAIPDWLCVAASSFGLFFVLIDF